jgi:hypothetical protein
LCENLDRSASEDKPHSLHLSLITTDTEHGLHPHRRIAAIQSERSLRMTLHGTLYEVTDFESFIRSYVMESRRPDPDSVRPIKDGRVTLCRSKGTGSGSPLSFQCRTDDTGRFELDLSQAPDAPVFLVAAGSEDWREHYWYRSKCVRPAMLDQHAREIYVARATIPDEAGFSQADLAVVLEEMKKQVADLERITGRVTGDGIALSGSGKGATASLTILLEPDRSDDFATLMRHALANFRLDLPGPAWLTGLLVSKDAAEESIRAGVQTLATQINERLRLSAIEAFTNQVADADRALAARLADTATLTLESLRYPLVAGQGEANSGHRAITGDVCLGFSRTLQPEERR